MEKNSLFWAIIPFATIISKDACFRGSEIVCTCMVEMAKTVNGEN